MELVILTVIESSARNSFWNVIIHQQLLYGRAMKTPMVTWLQIFPFLIFFILSIVTFIASLMSFNSSTSIYGIRNNGKQHGDVFTSPQIVRFMLDKVGYDSNTNLSHIRILEPSCGNGEFVVEIAKRLIQSAKLYHFDANTSFHQNVRAYDIDNTKIKHCRLRLMELGIIPNEENLQVADFLRCKADKADIVIGNPPYIRYENIPHDMLDFCRHNFSTFHYRCDLYIPFFEKTLSLLKKMGFIALFVLIAG